MSEPKIVTLSKLKSMSGADILSLIAAEGISVEINGVRAFDLVRPLNALDQKFLSVSQYVADEVSIELKRKIETLKVGDMFNPKNVQDVLNVTAAVVSLEDKAPVPEDEPAETVAPKAKTKPKKKPVRTAKSKAVTPEAKVVIVEELALSAFPENTEIDILETVHDLSADDIPGIEDEAPTAALFEDLILDDEDNLLLAETDIADTVSEIDDSIFEDVTADDVDDLDPLDDDEPLVRKLTKKSY